MTNRYSRHQAVINREKDAHIDDDYWFKQFEKSLQKNAVQPRRVDQSLFDQINSVMNGKSKHTSVSAAVEDMMQRSGLTSYLNNIKKSETDELKKKVAAIQQAAQQSSDTPEIFKLQHVKEPARLAINSLVSNHRGNLSLISIQESLRKILSKFNLEDKYLEDPKLVQYIFKLNQQEKEKNQNNDTDDYHDVGSLDIGNDFDFDAANDDMFHALMPAKR
jgi:hypothetical protein